MKLHIKKFRGKWRIWYNRQVSTYSMSICSANSPQEVYCKAKRYLLLN